MRINPKKSGTILIGMHHSARYVDQILIVQSYRNLGSLITPNLKLMDHANSILPKFHHIRTQLLPLILKEHFRLNLNLFTVFISPLPRHAYPYSLSTPKTKINSTKNVDTSSNPSLRCPHRPRTPLIADLTVDVDRTVTQK